MNSPCTDCPLARTHNRLRMLADAVCDDDLNRAIEAGLLGYVALAEREGVDPNAVCAACRSDDRCVTRARDERLRALAARERYRRREARLHERAQRRAERRAAAATPAQAAATATKPALPAAAAAALARAKAKAAAKRGENV
jgi:hypothetical protein